MKKSTSTAASSSKPAEVQSAEQKALERLKAGEPKYECVNCSS